jgi:hypothetical protein
MKLTILGIGVLLLASCSDPFHIDTTASGGGALEDCAASSDWLPNTPAVDMFKPLPHPVTECPFYRGGWQNFLIAMQPVDAQGTPAIFSYPTIDTTFQSSQQHAAVRSALGDIKQAGGRQILVDQNGNSLYYGIHVNQAFSDFIAANGLQTADAIRNAHTATPNLFFPAGVVEFKSAWQVVEGDAATIAAETANFISLKTTVPTLSVDPTTHLMVEDRDTPRQVTVRLLAIHVVYTLPGHPEFIWASFEHTTGAPDASAVDGHRDVAPIHPGDVNPDPTDPYITRDETDIADTDYLLYKAHTIAKQANLAMDETALAASFDPTAQKFMNQQTSIYRAYPASKSNTVDADDAITSLNHNVEAVFADAVASNAIDPTVDKRGNYRLVGGQWMDKPEYFAVDSPLQNDDSSPFAQPPSQGGVGIGKPAFDMHIQADGSDSPYSILAGEDRLSSTAMESFTQPPGSFPNCLSCHNTQAINSNGVPCARDSTGIKLIEPGLLNVSHVISQFLLEECQGSTPPAWCASSKCQ